METPDGYRHPETIAKALSTIQGRANDIQNIINCHAEEVGCNYQDDSMVRRYAAWRAASKEVRHA